jgi:hypothetical protein
MKLPELIAKKFGLQYRKEDSTPGRACFAVNDEKIHMYAVSSADQIGFYHLCYNDTHPIEIRKVADAICEYAKKKVSAHPSYRLRVVTGALTIVANERVRYVYDWKGLLDLGYEEVDHLNKFKQYENTSDALTVWTKANERIVIKDEGNSRCSYVSKLDDSILHV